MTLLRTKDLKDDWGSGDSRNVRGPANLIDYLDQLLVKDPRKQIGIILLINGRDRRGQRWVMGANQQAITDQLWACCGDELELSVFNSGVSSNASEDELLEMMKKLAVRAQNTMVNVVKFLEMAQDQDEAAGAYVARLKGQASVCNFAVKCTAEACEAGVS